MDILSFAVDNACLRVYNLKLSFKFKCVVRILRYDTRQSRLVYEFLKKNPSRHFCADEVYFALVNEGEKIGRSTVYRQLDRLVECEKAKRFFSGDGEAYCYQFSSSECKNHYHLVCSNCGKLIHTECDFLDRLSKHISDSHEFTLDTSRTVLCGLCADCAKEKNI